VRILRITLLACFCLCCGRAGLAQAVYGSTNLDIDADSGTVTATCETDADNFVAEYYKVDVSCVVEDSNNNIVAFGGGEDDSGQGYVQAVVTFTGVPGETYTAMSAHSVFAIFTVTVEQDPPQPIRLHYYDDLYDFSFYSENPQTYDNYFEWDSPGPETYTATSHEVTGSTQDTKTNAQLTCSPTPVIRGNTITCTASGARASYSNWQFTDGTNIVTSASTATTWSGIAVTSGVVSVTATSPDSSQKTISATITVIARSGWAFSAVQPARQTQDLSCGKSVTNPPQPSPALIGLSCLTVGYGNGTNAANITDGGPNNGYSFATSIVDASTYKWTIADDADTPSSTFYKAQCGNYDANNNSNGFISGINLDNDVQRHEMGSANSHYMNYSNGLSIAANNLGVQVEALVAFGGGYQSSLDSRLNQVNTSLQNMFNAEPCGTSGVRNASCGFDGYVNYLPYQACQ
jgi:hypothetical protein